MPAHRAYLDHNASAPLLPAAREAMLAALDAANPSSVHAEGRAARRIVERARAEVAALVNARPEHVVFTSGATEAASMLLTPDWRFGRAAITLPNLYVCEADHPCLLGGGRFPPDRVVRIGVDANGIIDLEALGAALKTHDQAAGPALVAVHAANNETGVIQPVAEIHAMVKAAGGVLVLDAVQAVGRVPIDITTGYGDFLMLSSHKIGGPKGVGAVVGGSDLMMPRPLISGGGQEKGHRAGTENLAGIAGFGAAASEALAGLGTVDDVRIRRDSIEAMIRDRAPGVEIFGADVERLPNTSFFALPGIRAETAQIAFDLAGVALSAGSACSSGKVGPSHVLKAMGFGGTDGALRVSIGRETGVDDIARFESALIALVGRATRTKAA